MKMGSLFVVLLGLGGVLSIFSFRFAKDGKINIDFYPKQDHILIDQGIFGDTVPYPFKFRDVGSVVGLLPDASNIRGHSAAWGDVNGDGWLDLYVGTFNDRFSKRNMLFINNQGQFTLGNREDINISSRSTGSIFVDLDNDGDLDLYVGSMDDKDRNLVGTKMFENDGEGNFEDISFENVAAPENFGGRSATVLDFDGDGLLDILIGEDYFFVGSERKPQTRLFKNKGGMEFEDVTTAAGLPEDLPGYGVAAADLNNDGWPDFCVASAQGGNKLFINNQDGTFTEASNLNDLFEWPQSGGDKMVCGVSFGDVNRDGKLDIILGPHFLLPAKNQEPVRLFLNMGNDDENIPIYKEVTEEAGLEPFPIKLPHVEIQDMDNDGWPDITTSAVRFKDGKPYPVIFRNRGLNENGIPVFQDFHINDYPTEEDVDMSIYDKSQKSLRKTIDDFWEKTLNEGKIVYGASAPTGDYNNDGRLDIFLVNWWPERSSFLLQNETPGGNWLQIKVKGRDGVNNMGIGAKVYIYRAGETADEKVLLGSQDISTGYGYASGHEAMVHFGLSEIDLVDIEVILPHDKGIITETNVKVNQRIEIE